MKEHPIICNSEMVKAILEGRKIMTRRPIKWDIKLLATYPDRVEAHYLKDGISHFCNDFLSHCPYGQVGDKLWVREAFKYIDFCLLDIGELHPRVKVEYKADNIQEWVKGDTHTQIGIPDKWRPSIFMPRWASRITLEITGIRVERLQEITEEDAKVEGINPNNPWGFFDGYINSFAWLWDSLNAKRGNGWETNPWVFVISFKVIDSLRTLLGIAVVQNKGG